MFTFIICLAILSILFWMGFKITGAVLKALMWLFILVPLAVGIWGFALLCCCTLILIPIGIRLFVAGVRVITLG